jgi:hypothetical protein
MTLLHQLSPDPLRAPGRVLPCHTLDAGDVVIREGRPGFGLSLRLAPPDETEDVAMPAEDGLGLHDHHGVFPPAQLARQKDND